MDKIGEAYTRACKRGSFCVEPYYRWDYDKETFKDKASSFDICFVAYDGYHVSKSLTTKAKAEKLKDELNACKSVEKCDELLGEKHSTPVRSDILT